MAVAYVLYARNKWILYFRKSEAELEQENYEQRMLLDDERRKAKETTERAKEMIK